MYRTIVWLVVLLCASCINAEAQSESVRCLDKGIPAEAAIVKGIETMYVNADTSDRYLRDGVRLARATGDSLAVYIGKYELANLYYHMIGQTSMAEEFMLLAMPGILSSECNTMKGYAHMLMGKIYGDQVGKFDSAMYHLQKAEQFNVQQGNTYRNWQVHHNMAKLYEDLHDSERAEKYFLLALDTVRLSGRRMDYGYLLNDVIEFYYNTDQLQKFADLQEEYITFLGEGADNARSSMHLNMIFDESIAPDDQEEVLLSYIPYHEKSRNVNSLVLIYLSLASLAENSGDLVKTRDYLKRGLTIHATTSSSGRLEFLARLKEIERKLGNYRSALNYADAELELRDSILRSENIRVVHDLEVQYETEKKEQTITLLSAEIEMQDLRMQTSRRNARRNALIAILVIALLTFIAISTFVSLRNKRVMNKALEEKNTIISHALSDKELLLKEIHHRVKNNLQVVSSLLYLQSEYIEDSNAQRALQDGRNRVQSMALIHKNLYQEENLTGIDMKEYFENLIKSLTTSYKVSPTEINIKTDIEPLFLDVDTVIPLALIVNELISNSLEHAFSTQQQGELGVLLKKQDEKLLLRVSDNGLGLPVEFSLEDSRSFGFELIQLFAEKLKAKIDIRNVNGLTVDLLIGKFKVA